MATFFGFIAIMMWGTLALLGSYTKAIPAFQLLFICFALSSIIFLIYKGASNEKKFLSTSFTWLDWLVGIGGLYTFHFCYFMALKYANALEVSLIAYLWPLLFSRFVASKATRFQAILGSIIGFIGIAFILDPSTSLSFKWQDIGGYLLALSCALIWSGYSWYFSSRGNRTGSDNDINALSQSIHEIGYFSIWVSLLALLSHFAFETSYWRFDTSEVIASLFLGLGPVGGAFYLWQLSLKSGNQLLLSSLSYCSPLFTALLLTFLGVSQWSINITIAILLILIGALVSNLPSRIRIHLFQFNKD